MVSQPLTSTASAPVIACTNGFQQCTVVQPDGPANYCYNPQVYACVKTASGNNLICPAAAKAACGNNCYDPAQFSCVDGVITAF
jgi:hypothetical protein